MPFLRLRVHVLLRTHTCCAPLPVSAVGTCSSFMGVSSCAWRGLQSFTALCVSVPALCVCQHHDLLLLTTPQVKGRTLLVASGSSSSEQLLAVAEASSASTAVWKAKRQMAKAEAAAKREAGSSPKRS